eukprot:TRINITY_DN1061_c0_g1_i1.p1 TRINITY_DN1061_c0_g1~~TRINITY_DN1061_c0_g1_i1.p1  ORF type:complete len:182 (-),score=35.48 TRINITY_DN1061_c0_g1_i1:242-787(-)
MNKMDSFVRHVKITCEDETYTVMIHPEMKAQELKDLLLGLFQRKHNEEFDILGLFDPTTDTLFSCHAVCESPELLASAEYKLVTKNSFESPNLWHEMKMLVSILLSKGLISQQQCQHLMLKISSGDEELAERWLECGEDIDELTYVLFEELETANIKERFEVRFIVLYFFLFHHNVLSAFF